MTNVSASNDESKNHSKGRTLEKEDKDDNESLFDSEEEEERIQGLLSRHGKHKNQALATADNCTAAYKGHLENIFNRIDLNRDEVINVSELFQAIKNDQEVANLFGISPQVRKFSTRSMFEGLFRRHDIHIEFDVVTLSDYMKNLTSIKPLYHETHSNVASVVSSSSSTMARILHCCHEAVKHCSEQWHPDQLRDNLRELLTSGAAALQDGKRKKCAIAVIRYCQHSDIAYRYLYTLVPELLINKIVVPIHLNSNETIGVLYMLCSIASIAPEVLSSSGGMVAVLNSFVQERITAARVIQSGWRSVNLQKELMIAETTLERRAKQRLLTIALLRAKDHRDTWVEFRKSRRRQVSNDADGGVFSRAEEWSLKTLAYLTHHTTSRTSSHDCRKFVRNSGVIMILDYLENVGKEPIGHLQRSAVHLLLQISRLPDMRHYIMHANVLPKLLLIAKELKDLKRNVAAECILELSIVTDHVDEQSQEVHVREVIRWMTCEPQRFLSRVEDFLKDKRLSRSFIQIIANLSQNKQVCRSLVENMSEEMLRRIVQCVIESRDEATIVSSVLCVINISGREYLYTSRNQALVQEALTGKKETASASFHQLRLYLLLCCCTSSRELMPSKKEVRLSTAKSMKLSKLLKFVYSELYVRLSIISKHARRDNSSRVVSPTTMMNSAIMKLAMKFWASEIHQHAKELKRKDGKNLDWSNILICSRFMYYVIVEGTNDEYTLPLCHFLVSLGEFYQRDKSSKESQVFQPAYSTIAVLNRISRHKVAMKVLEEANGFRSIASLLTVPGENRIRQKTTNELLKLLCTFCQYKVGGQSAKLYMGIVPQLLKLMPFCIELEYADNLFKILNAAASLETGPTALSKLGAIEACTHLVLNLRMSKAAFVVQDGDTTTKSSRNNNRKSEVSGTAIYNARIVKLPNEFYSFLHRMIRWPGNRSIFRESKLLKFLLERLTVVGISKKGLAKSNNDDRLKCEIYSILFRLIEKNDDESFECSRVIIQRQNIIPTLLIAVEKRVRCQKETEELNDNTPRCAIKVLCSLVSYDPSALVPKFVKANGLVVILMILEEDSSMKLVKYAIEILNCCVVLYPSKVHALTIIDMHNFVNTLYNVVNSSITEKKQACSDDRVFIYRRGRKVLEVLEDVSRRNSLPKVR